MAKKPSRKVRMKKLGLQVDPHNLRSGNWWYEENSGITVCVPCHNDVRQVHIRWTSLRAALRRKDAK